ISYPNINYVNGQPVINKAFILNGGINENTLKIFIREVNQNFVEATMTKRNSYSYTYSIPQSLMDKNIEFYFTYSGNNGQNYREPQTNYFRFKYGSLVVDNILTDVKSSDEIPSEFKLEQNYPNPFNPVTNISYSVSEPTFVTLKIYDFLGREISTLVNEYKQPGTYNSQFSIR
ncbi:MAG: hypothetical protein WHS65_14340, partial [Melioribacteraceae bacterium]